MWEGQNEQTETGGDRYKENRKVIDKDIKKTEREKRRQTEKDRKGEKRYMEMELGESEISET